MKHCMTQGATCPLHILLRHVLLGILKAPPSKLEVNTTPTAAVEVTGVGPQTTPIRVFQPVQGGSGTESRRNLLHVLLQLGGSESAP